MVKWLSYIPGTNMVRVRFSVWDQMDIDLRKKRFFFKKSCAYCNSEEMLELDKVEPYTWVTDSDWKLPEWEFHKFVLQECQVLCSDCYLRKKRVWNAIKRNEDLELWLHSREGSLRGLFHPSRAVC